MLAVAAVMAFHFGLPMRGRRFPGRRCLLRAERLPDHLAAAESARTRSRRGLRLLDPADAPPDSGPPRGDGRRAGVGRSRRPVVSPRRSARRHHGDAVLRRELAFHLDEHVLRQRRGREPAASTCGRSPSRSSSISSGRSCSCSTAIRRADGRGSVWSPSALLAGAGIVASAVRLGILWGAAGQDRAYLGTDSRIFEPLAGALLAVLMTSSSVRALHHPCALVPARGGRDRAGLGAGDARRPGRRDERIRERRRGRSSLRARRPSSPRSRREGSAATRALALPAVAYLGRLSYAHVPVALAA